MNKHDVMNKVVELINQMELDEDHDAGKDFDYIKDRIAKTHWKEVPDMNKSLLFAINWLTDDLMNM